MYVCIECGYEWDEDMFPKEMNCCPICGCGNIDEITDIQEWIDEDEKE